MTAEFFNTEIILAGGGLILLVSDSIYRWRRRVKTALAYAAVMGACWALQGPGGATRTGAFFGGDGLTAIFSLLALFGSAAAIAMSQSDITIRKFWGSYLALLLLATTGCLLLLKSRDFIYAFISIELISISSFILTAFERKELADIEGALKYFLVGAFSAAIGLYGISLIYTGVGSTEFARVAALDWTGRGAGSPAQLLTLGGLLMVVVSFGFKASLAPFHFWVPDAYQAAPIGISAYLSVVPKVSALGLLALLTSPFGQNSGLVLGPGAGTKGILAALACLTMTIGNFSALGQRNLKRMLAYSSIAQAGYMAIGVLVGTTLGYGAVAIYGAAYLFMNFGAFACAQWVERRSGSYEIEACDGLAREHLGFALAFTVFLLSLAGIPPLAGFLGKYAVFAGALEVRWAWWVAVVGALNSVVSVYYYLRIAYRIYFIEEPLAPAGVPQKAWALNAAIGVLLAGTVLLGLYPSPLIALSVP